MATARKWRAELTIMTFVTSPKGTGSRSNTMVPFFLSVMTHLLLCVIVQFCLAFGMAGLFWPEKLMPLFGILLFPWAASYRAIWANSVAVIALSLLLFAKLLLMVS